MPNPYHDPANGEFTTKGAGRTISPRGSFESRPGGTTEEFLREHPKPTSKHRTTIVATAQRNAWTDTTNPALRKEETYVKGHVRIRINYNESGTPIRAYLHNERRMLAAVSKSVMANVGKWLEMDIEKIPR